MNAELNITAIERKSIGVGSIVRLKSGGPQMTVAERSADKANCFWHQDNGDLRCIWVPLICLVMK